VVSVISDHRSWQCGHLRRRVHRFVEACWLALSSHSERSVLRPHPRSSISASPSDAESTDCCRCPLRSPAPRLHPCHGPTTLRGTQSLHDALRPLSPREGLPVQGILFDALRRIDALRSGTWNAPSSWAHRRVDPCRHTGEAAPAAEPLLRKRATRRPPLISSGYRRTVHDGAGVSVDLK
jgi:hypothetical protein